MTDSRARSLAPALRSLVTAPLTLFYPDGCIACSSDVSFRDHLCPACEGDILDSQSHMCLRCAAHLGPHVKPARECYTCHSRHYSFHRVLAVGGYDGPLGPLVRAYKYHHHLTLADPMADWMTNLLLREGIAPDVVISVPMHPFNVLRRGFDHAGLLASKVARRISRPRLKRVLRQKKLGPNMVGLSYAQRQKRAREAYSVRTSPRLVGRSVLLIDDVLTTGATASECARLLHTAGARRITVLVVARQSHRGGSNPSPLMGEAGPY